jgi:hypothetical protein
VELVRDQESLYSADIVEAPSRHVHQVGRTPTMRPLRYATLGMGLDVGRLVWTEAIHVYSSQCTDLDALLPGRPSTTEVGPPHRLRSDQFLHSPVDLLLMDLDDSEHWERCMEKAVGTEAAPTVILQCLPPEFLAHNTHETTLHQRDKYHVVYWFLRAHEFGAALHQDRLFVVYYLSADGSGGPKQPEPDHLPPRSMANLLSPTGIPPRAYLGGPAVPEPPMYPYAGPCEVIRCWGRDPVYTPNGLMPDDLSAILEVRNRCRRLQVEELVRAKGNPSEWNCKLSCRLPNAPVSRCTSLHLLAAVGDSVTAWWQARYPSEIKASSHLGAETAA